MSAKKFQNIFASLPLFLVLFLTSNQLDKICASAESESVQLSRNLRSSPLGYIEMQTSAKIGMDTTFVYGIFSMKHEKRRRDVIRWTYLKDPRLCPLEDLLAPNKDTPTTCSIYYTFVIAGGDNSAPTEHIDDGRPITLDPSTEEEKDYRDIVRLSIKENMNNGKSVTWFKYAALLASQGHNIDYVGKMDADTLPNPDGFIDWIQMNLPPAPFNRRIYGGRSGPDWINNGYYSYGEFYFMSIDLATYVSMELTHEFRVAEDAYKIEDLDMGHLVHTSNLPTRLIDLSSSCFWLHPVKQEMKWWAYFENQEKYEYKPRKNNFGLMRYHCKSAGYRMPYVESD